jgi:ribosomal protein L24E
MNTELKCRFCGSENIDKSGGIMYCMDCNCVLGFCDTSETMSPYLGSNDEKS